MGMTEPYETVLLEREDHLPLPEEELIIESRLVIKCLA
jgi:hypothetical protein